MSQELNTYLIVATGLLLAQLLVLLALYKATPTGYALARQTDNIGLTAMGLSYEANSKLELSLPYRAKAPWQSLQVRRLMQLSNQSTLQTVLEAPFGESRKSYIGYSPLLTLYHKEDLLKTHRRDSLTNQLSGFDHKAMYNQDLGDPPQSRQ